MAILQSNYVPWRGYLDLIAFVDEFTIYDDVQYTKNEWNRNWIKTKQGLQWITVPVVKAYLGQTIRETRLTNYSWGYELGGGKTERLANLCHQAAATEYFSGPSARSYLDERVFDENDIRLNWFDYDGYSDYPQLWVAFEPAVSILDLLFNVGAEATDHLGTVTVEIIAGAPSASATVEVAAKHYFPKLQKLLEFMT